MNAENLRNTVKKYVAQAEQVNKARKTLSVLENALLRFDNEISSAIGGSNDQFLLVDSVLILVEGDGKEGGFNCSVIDYSTPSQLQGVKDENVTD